MKKTLCITILLMLILSACSAPTEPPATSIPTQPTASEPVPTVTEPAQTEPPVTEPPELPEPFVAHEKFSTLSCASLLGTWSVKVRLDWQLQNLDQFTGHTEFTLYYSFGEDGCFRAYADQTEFDRAIDNYEAMVIEHMLDLRYAAFKGPLEYQGIPEENIVNMWKNGEKEKARQEVKDSVAALNLYHRFRQLLREGQFYVEGGKLYTQVDEDTFECSSYSCADKTLILKNTDHFSVYRPLCIRFPFYLSPCNEDAAA